MTATVMVQYYPKLPFFYAFFAVKFLKILYLNDSSRSVDLMCGVRVTEKTRHRCFTFGTEIFLALAFSFSNSSA